MRNPNAVTRLLLVDDSPLFMEAFLLLAEGRRDLDVVATAGNGKDALREVLTHQPDVVVMDVHMPVMDGLEAVEWIMSTRPTPIVLLTGDPSKQNHLSSFDALSRGALDLLAKPSLNTPAAALECFLDHIRLMATIPVVHHRRRSTIMPRQPPKTTDARSAPTQAAVGIVASTGGPPVLAECIAALPATFPAPILVVQHLSPGFTEHLVSWLDSTSQLDVCVATGGEPAVPGKVYIAPDDRHLFLSPKGRLRLGDGPLVEGHRPSGTLLLESLAEACGPSGVGLILTGMGSDGCDGLMALNRAGGACFAQDEATSVVFGMPKAALESGAASKAVPRSALAETLLCAVHDVLRHQPRGSDE